jgi:hypothetical protein
MILIRGRLTKRRAYLIQLLPETARAQGHHRRHDGRARAKWRPQGWKIPHQAGRETGGKNISTAHTITWLARDERPPGRRCRWRSRRQTQAAARKQKPAPRTTSISRLATTNWPNKHTTKANKATRSTSPNVCPAKVDDTAALPAMSSVITEPSIRDTGTEGWLSACPVQIVSKPPRVP